MEKIVEKKDCTGCTACVGICPKNAIKMVENDEGFKYPEIDKSKCVNCGLCKKTCPILNLKNNNSFNKCYVGYIKDTIEKMRTSSGGLFSAIANYFLEADGIVIGAAYDEKFTLNHIAISKKEDLIKLNGSKYVQSNLNDIFTFIKNNIRAKKILFVGTPCQVAGLRVFLKSDYENLTCIDLVCHGVPSIKLLKKYIQELEIKQKSKMLTCDFRDKKTGWSNYSCTYTFENSKVSNFHCDDDYVNIYLSNVALRESCYNCKFKIGNKYSDITLGDFWGVKNYYPEFFNDKGVSAIILNTEKGIEVFDKIKDKIIFKECDLTEIINGNSSLKDSPRRPSHRDKFYEKLNHKSIRRLSSIYNIKTPIYLKVIKKIKKYLRLENKPR